MDWWLAQQCEAQLKIHLRLKGNSMIHPAQHQSTPKHSSSQRQSAPHTAKAAASAPAALNPPTHDDIALRAFAIYAEKGRAKGHCQQNWYQAEHELGKQQMASDTAEYETTPLANRDGSEPADKKYDQVMPSPASGRKNRP